MRSVLSLLVFSVLVTGCATYSTTTWRGPASAVARKPAFAELAADEKRVLELLNKLRKSKGIQSDLVFDENLQEAAELHSKYMTKIRRVTHEEPTRVTHHDRIQNADEIYGIDTGENVGCGFTADTLMEDWIDSDEHLENMIDPKFTHVGIARRGSGKLINAPGCSYDNYWTLVLGRRKIQ